MGWCGACVVLGFTCGATCFDIMDEINWGSSIKPINNIKNSSFYIQTHTKFLVSLMLDSFSINCRLKDENMFY